jgi:hypothetical protein
LKNCDLFKLVPLVNAGCFSCRLILQVLWQVAGLSDGDDAYRSDDDVEDDLEDESFEEYIEDSDDGARRKRKAAKPLKASKQVAASGRGRRVGASTPKASAGREKQDDDAIRYDDDDHILFKENARGDLAKPGTIQMVTAQVSPGIVDTQTTSTQGGTRKRPTSFMHAIHPPKPKGENWGAAK